MSFNPEDLPAVGTPEHWELIRGLGMEHLFRAADKQHLTLEVEKHIVTESDPSHTWDIGIGVIGGFRRLIGARLQEAKNQRALAFLKQGEALKARARGEGASTTDDSERELGEQIAEVLPYIMIIETGVTLQEWVLFYTATVPDGILEQSPADDQPTAAQALMSGPGSAFEIILNTLIPGWIDLDGDKRAEGITTVLQAGSEFVGQLVQSLDPTSTPSTPTVAIPQNTQGPIRF